MQHLLAAAAGGNQAHAHFHQPHVQFGRRLNPRAVQRDFAAAAESHAERRGHHRLRRILQRHVELLKAVDRGVQLVPLLFLRGQQNHHQIGARRRSSRPDCRSPWRRNSFPVPPAPARTMCRMSSPSAFILLWNSQQSTPSPRSISEAPGVLLHHAARALQIGQDGDAGPRFQFADSRCRRDRSIRCGAGGPRSAAR